MKLYLTAINNRGNEIVTKNEEIKDSINLKNILVSLFLHQEKNMINYFLKNRENYYDLSITVEFENEEKKYRGYNSFHNCRMNEYHYKLFLEEIGETEK
jgi:hypothetical protein